MSDQQMERPAGMQACSNLPLGGPKRTYYVTLERGGGWITAHCDELAAVTQGRTPDEVEKNIIEVVELALDDDGSQEFIIATRELRQ